MSSNFTDRPCAECGKRKSPTYRDKRLCYTCDKAHSKARSLAAHASRTRQRYGITQAEYWALYEAQGGKCYICHKGRGLSKRLAVDHDHKCTEGHAQNWGCQKCIRGLLCSSCNTFLGRTGDDPSVGERLAEYLRNPPWRVWKSRQSSNTTEPISHVPQPRAGARSSARSTTTEARARRSTSVSGRSSATRAKPRATLSP